LATVRSPRDLTLPAVAIVVVALAIAGCGSTKPARTSTAATTTQSGGSAVEHGGKLQLEANPSGQLAYTTKTAVATAGRVTISMRNMSGVMHDVAIQSGTSGPVLGHSEFQSEGTSSFTVKLKPGTYTFFCQAPGHRAAGMYGTLTVK
jgi:plastocyanin